jgi:hypothetical protein
MYIFPITRLADKPPFIWKDEPFFGQPLSLASQPRLAAASQLSCGNFSGTSSHKFRGTKESMTHTFMGCVQTGNLNPEFQPFHSPRTILLAVTLRHEDIESTW